MAEPNQKHRTKERSLLMVHAAQPPGSGDRHEGQGEDIQPRDILCKPPNFLIHSLVPIVSTGICHTLHL